VSYWRYRKIQSAFQGIDDPVPGFSFTVYPNPMVNQSMVEFNLYQRKQINIAVYNIMGNQVKTMTEAVYTEEIINLSWIAARFPRNLFVENYNFC